MIARYMLAMIIAIAVAIIAVIRCTPVRADEDHRRVDTAIVFVVDVSGSMKRHEIEAARQAHAAAMLSPDVLDAIREGGDTRRIAVAYIEFGDVAQIGIDWMIVSDAGDARLFAALIDELPVSRYLGSQYTAVGAALLMADEMMGRAPPALRMVVDVIGDGKNTTVPHPDVGRAALLSRGVVINAMPVLMDAPDQGLTEWYADVVGGGPGHFVMPIAGIDKLPMALRSKIVQELY